MSAPTFSQAFNATIPPQAFTQSLEQQASTWQPSVQFLSVQGLPTSVPSPSVQGLPTNV